MYDAIVIGARCAGAPVAMLLARKGYKVLLLDRSTFPSEIAHGHFIHRQGPKLLARWGLLDKIVESNCPAVLTQTTDYGDFPLIGRMLVMEEVAFGYAPRRSVLDKVLIDAAIDAGVELREGFFVEDFLAEDDRLVGIRGRSNRGGAVVTERAHITIGADGRKSHLARAVRAPVYQSTRAFTCWYFSYWSGVLNDGLEIYLRQRRVIFAFPTNNQLFSIFIGWPIEEFLQVRSDIAGSFMRVLELAPQLVERVRNGRREERFYGMADLPNFFRKPYGPGWALVGDAGCHKDPFTALGICDAFRDAELLANAVDEGLSGKRSIEESMADYEKRRNEASATEYQRNIDFARFKPLPPETYQLRAALRGNQEDINRFIMATEGMIPREEFFNPQNMRRIMVAAG
ncbi:MAG TPA: NAD(P)/FAD-dependent oxidoreductase [Chthoniobacterales bacterium]|nr:NAD(P)/FAD-dependent oxidoreductase [Chthoniobacterales bacterium]